MSNAQGNEGVDSYTADQYLSDYLTPNERDAVAAAGAATVGLPAGYAFGDPVGGVLVTAFGTGAAYAGRRLRRYDEGADAARNSIQHFRELWGKEEQKE